MVLIYISGGSISAVVGGNGSDLGELTVTPGAAGSENVSLGASLAPPRGKWAQSMENMEQGGPLVIKSVLASDPVVHLPRLNKSKSEGAVNVVVNEEDEKDDPASQESSTHNSGPGSGVLSSNASSVANNKTNTNAATEPNSSSSSSSNNNNNNTTITNNGKQVTEVNNINKNKMNKNIKSTNSEINQRYAVIVTSCLSHVSNVNR
ncbi:WD repeat-containing protein 62-like, partial [Tropilaelaps mercedesae]